MQINEKQQSTNANHNYDNRRSYNNLPLQPEECLVPIRVDWEMVKHFNMCQDNLETWHIGPNKCLLIKQLSVTSNSYICSGHTRIGTDAKEHKVFASES